MTLLADRVTPIPVQARWIHDVCFTWTGHMSRSVTVAALASDRDLPEWRIKIPVQRSLAHLGIARMAKQAIGSYGSKEIGMFVVFVAR
jgi:hypothetical protein